MGKLVYLMNVSLDGYVETPDHSLDWAGVDEEIHRWFGDRAREAAAGENSDAGSTAQRAVWLPISGSVSGSELDRRRLIEKTPPSTRAPYFESLTMTAAAFSSGASGRRTSMSS